MFNAINHGVIDAVQDAKSNFVNSVFKESQLRAPLSKFVEDQRKFTKEYNDSVTDSIYTISQIFTKPAFYKSVADQVQAQYKAALDAWTTGLVKPTKAE